MMKKNVFILGAGGHAKVVINSLSSYADINILGILDVDKSKIGKSILEIEIIGTDELLNDYSSDEIYLVNAIGSTVRPKKRAEIHRKFKSLRYKFLSVVHESACIANDVEIGEGVHIMAGVIIQPGCVIGDNVIINTAASIDHDGFIGNNSHLAPGAVCSGNVKIGEGVHIGTGAVVIQNINIGDDCLVAAGSVVAEDITVGSFVMGVPAKKVHAGEQ